MGILEKFLIYLAQTNPAYILMGAALFMHKMPRFIFNSLALVTPVYCAILVTFLAYNNIELTSFSANFKLITIYFHPYSRIVVTAFLIALLLGTIFALGNSKSKNEISAAFFHAGGAIGVVLAGDIITFFIMWELMTVGSVIIIFDKKTKQAYKSAMRYVLIHLMGGVILLAGFTLYINQTESLLIPELLLNINDLDQLTNILDYNNLYKVLILIGILINVAAPPFSSWLTDSYPEASPTGSVFLSTYTTKTALFALITMFAGSDILIYIGAFMILYGVCFTILENNIRRMLSYSIINQIGVIVTAIGVGTEIALNGAALGLFSSIMYNTLLFMCAGSVLYMTGKSKLSQLGGLHKSMKLTLLCSIIGALTISSFPFTSGFISKSIIGNSFYDNIILWLIFLASGALIFLSVGIRFIWFIFFHKDSGLQPKEQPLYMQLAMILCSIMCVVPGLYPELMLYELLPNDFIFHAHSTKLIINQIQLLFFAGFSFFIMLPLLKNTKTISLDFDWLYRVLLYKIYLFVSLAISYLYKISDQLITVMAVFSETYLDKFYGKNGKFTQINTISFTITSSLTILLIISIIIFYIT